MVENKNKFPYIVAYGVSKDQIGQYYVEIEKHLFSVSAKSWLFIFTMCGILLITHEWNRVEQDKTIKTI